nr:LAGLIDADG family homing endonuclease [Agrobacterium sp. RC10-4-1]
MHKFFEPWAARSGREAGWLAGIYDGEGYLSIKNRRGTQLGVAQKPGVVLSEIERLLKNFGYSNYRYAQTGNAGSGVISLQSQGGFATIAHLLGSLQPIRLVSKFVNSLRSGEFDKQLQSDGVPLEIVAAYDEGEQWVAGLETSSHTYFCEGFGAHNCVAEHSVLIARYLAAKHAPEVALAGLLHDAPEAYCVDIPRPLKPYLTNYRAIEQDNWLAIAARFDLPKELPRAVHDADNRIIADELVNLRDMPWHAKHDRPLGVKLRYWSPEEAELEFLATFDALMAGRAA